VHPNEFDCILHIACSTPFCRTRKQTRRALPATLPIIVSSSAAHLGSGATKIAAFFASLPAAPPAWRCLDGKGDSCCSRTACLGQLGGKNVVHSTAPLVVLVSCLPRRLLARATRQGGVVHLLPPFFPRGLLVTASADLGSTRCMYSMPM
jgi:hypothetical protein